MIKRVERREGTRFQVYARRDGKKVYVSTHESRSEAKAADEDHRVTQRKIAAGELPEDTDLKRTFGDATKQWIATLKKRGSRSADEYEGRLENHLLPTFRDVPLVAITKATVVRWRDKMMTTSTAPTVNAMMVTLSSACSFFVESGWLQHNPCHRVKSLEVITKIFPWLQSTEAITRLLGECLPNIRTLIAVLVGTGMRLDEALHLRWDDIDLEHRLITVHRGRKGMTKSGKMRRVPIFDSVMPVLKAMKLARAGAASLLWPGASGQAKTQSAIRKPFKLAAERAELPDTLRLHDLRHTFASLFLIDGGDIFKLSKILGHSSVTITEKTYAHLKPTAYETDYSRVAFRMPRDGAAVLAFPISGDRRDTAP